MLEDLCMKQTVPYGCRETAASKARSIPGFAGSVPFFPMYDLFMFRLIGLWMFVCRCILDRLQLACMNVGVVDLGFDRYVGYTRE